MGETLLDRKAIFDIYCESFTGEKFVVEVQKAKQTYFKDRSIYYSIFPIQQQAKRGDWNFQKRPKALQAKVFKKLFNAAEIAKFTPEDRDAYQSSLKYYRDLKNVVDTSKEEGREGGIEEGIKRVAIKMKSEGIDISRIAKLTGLSQKQIETL